MAKEWREVRARGRQLREGVEERAAGLRDQMRAEVRAYRVAEVRKAQHLSRTALAETMGVKQSRVSAIERGQLSRIELGTLESYVEVLGGRVLIVADFGDESLTIG